MSDSPQNPYIASGQNAGPISRRVPSSISQTAMTGVVITLALASSVVVLSGILSYLTLSDFPEDQPLFQFGGNDLLFLIVGAAATILTVPIAAIVPQVMKKQATEQLRSADVDLPRPLNADSELPVEAKHFLGAMQTSAIIGQALFEGPAMMNAVLMMIDHNFAHLIFVAIGLVGILAQTPTAGRLTAAIEDASMPR
ncbi:hypothetical protein [Rhodopirellula sp. MGV]|uniref:hypothetical protein n=1 Tax=Rhodopirellula sp. MGV TaxID=2023130 RepID=UPI000B96E612|nr:hypothetical protein [Rhodopirellula sp. MGV]OYP36671.1 hypothetical protein CGZ80_07760 [Rhodopirellula sp. MGV]PNY36102.1 hypothetical protein C2E31_14720 [Rhodopirellula baltica]PNY36106.1 hypothetical protein C2E31_14745 [Rhodopirellula baltica]